MIYKAHFGESTDQVKENLTMICNNNANRILTLVRFISAALNVINFFHNFLKLKLNSIAEAANYLKTTLDKWL